MKKSVVVLLALLLAQQAVSAPPAKAETKDPSTLAKARAAAAQKVYEGALERRKIDTNPPGLDFLYTWSRRWAKAEREANKDKAGQVAALERHLERMKKLESMTKMMQRSGGFVARYEVFMAEFYRLEAEGWLARGKAK
jgi:hypothetical protein